MNYLRLQNDKSNILQKWKQKAISHIEAAAVSPNAGNSSALSEELQFADQMNKANQVSEEDRMRNKERVMKWKEEKQQKIRQEKVC